MVWHGNWLTPSHSGTLRSGSKDNLFIFVTFAVNCLNVFWTYFRIEWCTPIIRYIYTFLYKHVYYKLMLMIRVVFLEGRSVKNISNIFFHDIWLEMQQYFLNTLHTITRLGCGCAVLWNRSIFCIFVGFTWLVPGRPHRMWIDITHETTKANNVTKAKLIRTM